MVSDSEAQQSALLRVITQRLAATPARQLPQVVPFLASSLVECREQLCLNGQEIRSEAETENAILMHKFKTQISSLLLDKSPQARYAATILIKTTIQLGGSGVLQGVASWVRGLVGIIGVCVFVFPYASSIGLTAEAYQGLI